MVETFKKATQNGDLDWFLDLTLGATKDVEGKEGTKGIYHIRQDWWQSIGIVGYNDFYDFVFKTSVSMTGGSSRENKFPFSVTEQSILYGRGKVITSILVQGQK